jgi:hypothetical protein
VIKTLGEQMRTRVLAMACLLLMLFTSCKNTINESIRVADRETIGENIKTANGEILLTSGARVKGDIVVDADPDQFDGSEEQKVLIIRIEQNSVVEGDIIVKRHYRPVEVHLSDEGRVLGQIDGAKLVGRPSI